MGLSLSNKTTLRREIAPIANTFFCVVELKKKDEPYAMRGAFMNVKGHCGEMKEAIKIKRSQNIWAIIVCGSV